MSRGDILTKRAVCRTLQVKGQRSMFAVLLPGAFDGTNVLLYIRIVMKQSAAIRVGKGEFKCRAC